MLPAARGRRVRARLEVLGLTAKWLGEQIGESEAQISKMLNGQTKGGIDPIEAWRIALAIGLTQAYILWGDRRDLPPDVLRSVPAED